MSTSQIKRTIVYGLFAPRTDWRHEQNTVWRPLISLCTFADLPIDELHLFFSARNAHFLESVREDIHAASPKTAFHAIVRTDPAPAPDAVHLYYYNYFKDVCFDIAHNDYYIYLPFGVFPNISYAIIMAINTLHLPIKIIQVYQYEENSIRKDNYTIFETNLSKTLMEEALYVKNHLPDQDFLKSGIPTQNTRYNTIIMRLEHVAVNSRLPILLMGDTGTGKSQLARAVYELKKRRGLVSGSFVALNCSVLRGDMGMAALFGHSKGAFTGAATRREGCLLAAHNGVLFLDEVAELRLEEQALLLKALEEKSFLPLGSDAPVHSDFQLICGTNQDMPALVREGKFRQDLFARINVWQFALPALRDRPEDILPNIEYELQRCSRERGQHFTFSPLAKTRFQGFAVGPHALWPGNFRELAASMDRMTTFSVDNVITLAVVEEEIAHLAASWQARNDMAPTPQRTDAMLLDALLGQERRSQLDLFEQFHLANTVRVCQNSATKAEAGKMLFAVSRLRKRRQDDANRLHKYLQNYGLTWDDIRRMQP